jgi:predicted dehydrogenase
MSSQPLRVGVIGCGVIAPTHIESFQQVPGVEVAWACDLIAERAKAVARRYGIAQHTTVASDMLADRSVDIVCVCTDHASHAELSIAALEAGKHVLCEKCLTANQKQLDQMLDAAARHPQLKFAGVFQHRFDPINRRLRELVESGQLGDILTASARLRCHRPDSYYGDGWHGTWAKEGGSVLINQAIHFLDSIQWVAGGVEAVSAAHANLGHRGLIETEDTLVAALRYRGGMLGTFEATSASHLNWSYKLAIYGTRGTVELRDDRVHRLHCKDDQQEQRIRELLESLEPAEGVSGAAEHYGKGHLAQVRDFVAAVREDRPPFVTVQSAAETARLVFAAYDSARTGTWVELPEPVRAT